jgi:hypothetical protein
MKKAIALGALIALMLVTPALASKPVVRPGQDYDGYANPNGCKILVHGNEPNELHVSCLRNAGATGPARIRYRYLKNYGGEFRPAGFTADVVRHGGDCSGVRTRWMVAVPRTGRVIIPFGCYAHIVSVTWEQP